MAEPAQQMRPEIRIGVLIAGVAASRVEDPGPRVLVTPHQGMIPAGHAAALVRGLVGRGEHPHRTARARIEVVPLVGEPPPRLEMARGRVVAVLDGDAGRLSTASQCATATGSSITSHAKAAVPGRHCQPWSSRRRTTDSGDWSAFA
jgi:hypothetical protein